MSLKRSMLVAALAVTALALPAHADDDVFEIRGPLDVVVYTTERGGRGSDRYETVMRLRFTENYLFVATKDGGRAYNNAIVKHVKWSHSKAAPAKHPVEKPIIVLEEEVEVTKDGKNSKTKTMVLVKPSKSTKSKSSKSKSSKSKNSKVEKSSNSKSKASKTENKAAKKEISRSLLRRRITLLLEEIDDLMEENDFDGVMAALEKLEPMQDEHKTRFKEHYKKDRYEALGEVRTAMKLQRSVRRGNELIREMAKAAKAGDEEKARECYRESMLLIQNMARSKNPAFKRNAQALAQAFRKMARKLPQGPSKKPEKASKATAKSSNKTAAKAVVSEKDSIKPFRADKATSVEKVIAECQELLSRQGKALSNKKYKDSLIHFDLLKARLEFLKKLSRADAHAVVQEVEPVAKSLAKVAKDKLSAKKGS